MTALHIALGVAIVAAFTATTLLGAWRWWRGERSQWFWRLLRVGQALLVVQAALGGLLSALGHTASGQLHVLYGLLPLAVSFAAEQLRVTAADTVLDARGLPDAQAVGRLPEADQRAVVGEIVRRELGVMAAASAVIVGLALRAALG
jgi:hypothetical protein